MSLSPIDESSNNVHELQTVLGDRISWTVPVSEIPNELILNVFEHALHADEPCPTLAVDVRQHARVPIRPLLSLTHVCRRWRHVAIAHPLLWQRVDCHNVEQLLEFALRRSHPGPLSLIITAPQECKSDREDALRSVLLSCSRRLRRLDFAYGSTSHPFLRTQLYDLDCPNLECLTITDYPIAAPPTARELPEVSLSRRPLFCGGLSRLRALAISPIPYWLPTNDFLVLTHLFLSPHWFSNVRMHIVLSFLARTPALEVLHLSHLGLLPDSDKQQEHSYVRLHRLRYLLFSDASYFQSSLSFLEKVKLPRSARVYLSCIAITSTDPHSIIPPLAPTADTDRLSISIRDEDLTLAAQASEHHSEFWLSGCETPESDDDCFATWLTRLPTMFPLSRLSYLQLRLELPASSIVQILREATAVTTLELAICEQDSEPGDQANEDSVVRICRALGESADSAAGVPLCPALSVLALSLGGRILTPRETYTHWLDALMSMVRVRAARRCPLRSLAVQPMQFAMHPDLPDPRAPFADEVCAAYTAALAEHVEHVVVCSLGEKLTLGSFGLG